MIHLGVLQAQRAWLTKEDVLTCLPFAELETCNWLVLSSDGQEYCRSCRLTETVPDLSDAERMLVGFDLRRR